MTGEWIDEGQEHQIMEIVIVNDKPALVIDERTFPIKQSEDAMSVDINGGTHSVLYDRKNDILFLKGEKFIRTKNAQKPNYNGVYASKDINSETVLLSINNIDNRGAVVTVYYEDPDIYEPIREYHCAFNNGVLEYKGRDISLSGDTQWDAYYIFKYNHAENKLVWSAKEKDKLVELQAFPEHRKNEESVYTSVKDDFTGEWKSYPDGIVSDKYSDWKIIRIGKTEYMLEFVGSTEGESSVFAGKLKRSGHMLLGTTDYEYKRNNRVTLTLISDKEIGYSDPYMYRLLKRR